ncbi:MAG: tripartite tricarboxylate transporter substrate binding protein [bacterium]
MHIKHKFLAMSLTALTLTLGLGATLQAQPTEWPARAVTMVVPFPPGGPTDLIARVLARQLSEQLGQTFVVDNKGGANGNIGGQAVASAKPDGYTVLYNTSSLALSPSLYKELSYSPQKDLTPVSTTAVVPLVLVINPKLPVNTLEEFIAYAKKNPGKLSYASSGNGNITHLGAFLLNQATGIDAVHVPYRGSAPAMIDLVGGQVQYDTNTLNDSIPFIRDHRVKALAVTSATRSPLLPDVPTVAETVVPGFEMGAWQGIVVPAGTDPAIITKFNAEILKALKSPVVIKQLQEQGAQVLGSSPEEYKTYLASEIKRFADIVQAAGVTLN